MDVLEQRDAPPSSDRPRHRRAGGRRSAHVARTRRRMRRTGGARLVRLLVVILVGVVVIGAAVWGVASLGGSEDAAPPPAPAAPAAGPVDQTVLAWIRTAEPGGPATGITLLSASDDGTGSATFVPASTLVEIPGIGLDRLGLAQQYGGPALTAAAIGNAIGIDVDAALAVDQASLGAFLQQLGGADITIPDRLVHRAADGTGTVAFDSGDQFLNGVRLAEYWAFSQRGESELDTFPRQQRALDAMWGALADVTPERALAELPGEVSRGDEPAVRAVLASLAAVGAEGTMSYQLLPVEPFGSAGESHGASYELDTDGVQAMVEEHFAGAIPQVGERGPLSLQVLNGIGTPGIGQQVDEHLDGMGLRIVRTENARSFDILETQIIVYEEDPAILEAARRVQQALGVGTIQSSRQPQSVVDLTVVVGGDFIGRGPDVPNGL